MSSRNTHTTRKEAEHIRRASRPSSSSLSIKRSERFPDCLLEIPLATLWPKQTLRLATRTYSPHNNYLPTPRRLHPIYYSCVCAITSTALHPASLTQPHSHRHPSPCGPGHIERYLGKGTFRLNKLRAEIESENEGVEIPMEMRWLGWAPSIKERYHAQQIRGSSVTFVVRCQGTAERLIISGLKVLGKQYKVEAFIEARPDTICGACSGWGHGEHNFAFFETPKCALCAGLVLTTVRSGSHCGSPRHSIKTSGAIKYLNIYLTRK